MSPKYPHLFNAAHELVVCKMSVYVIAFLTFEKFKYFNVCDPTAFPLKSSLKATTPFFLTLVQKNNSKRKSLLSKYVLQ